MKAVVLKDFGGVDNLELKEVDDPIVGKGSYWCGCGQPVSILSIGKFATERLGKN